MSSASAASLETPPDRRTFPGTWVSTSGEKALPLRQQATYSVAHPKALPTLGKLLNPLGTSASVATLLHIPYPRAVFKGFVNYQQVSPRKRIAFSHIILLR